MVKQILLKHPDFQNKGLLVFAKPLNGVLRGFYFEGSDFNSSSFYVWAFVQPLFATGTMKAQADFVWWALVAGSICQGLLMSYIFNKWANIHSLGAGATAGAVISFFVTAGFDLTMFATSNLSTLTGSCVDIIAGTVMGAIVGGAVGMANGMGSKKTA